MFDTEKGVLAKVIGPKVRWRRYKARVGQLPPNHRTAVEEIERYLMHFVPTDGDSDAERFEDLVGLFEQAEANGTPIREVVGQDPVKFAEAFVRDHTEGGYVPARARKRLAGAIERAAGE
ncbi:DUF1048 domain-containing protein [Nonomuraea longicatena]|uniref:DUF1048 domain-containing protein n=1 Tax=Nonomuraea longicatena TaxID=83682 RepID=A0ABN1QXS4_9ACTN